MLLLLLLLLLLLWKDTNLLLSTSLGQLCLILLTGLSLKLRVNLSGLGVSAQRPAEKEDMRFGTVDSIMLPAAGLLNTNSSPLGLGQET